MPPTVRPARTRAAGRVAVARERESCWERLLPLLFTIWAAAAYFLISDVAVQLVTAR